MKKRITAILMAALMACSVLLTSCGKFDYRNDDLSAYIEVGTYKGLAFEITAPKEIDEQAINDELVLAFSEYSSLEVQDADYAAKEGDTVNISYVGKIGGEEFEGGSAENQSLELGSDTYIDGFEDQLIGAKTGEKKTLELKFPTDYGKEELNGKDVVFEVTVNSVSVQKFEYAKNITDATPLEEGDEAVITYTLTVPGVDDYEENGLDHSITIGESSSKLPVECSKALVGLKVGDKDKEIKVTLPSDISNEAIAGKEASFVVTVVSATRTTVTDEIDDSMIASVTDSDTLEAYKNDVILPDLTAQAEKEAKTANMSGLWKKILDAATVKSYPAGEVKRITNDIYKSFAGQIGNSYNMSLREYVDIIYGISLSEFKETLCKPQAEATIKEQLVFNYIVKAENVTLTDEEKAEGLKTYYEELGMSSSYETYEDFEAAIANGEILTDVLYDSMLWEKLVTTLLETVTK